MRRLTLAFVLVTGALALTPSGAPGQPPAGAAKKSGPPRELSRADAEWVTKKYAEAVKFGRAGKWGHDEAQAPVREILALCIDKLGDDHFTTRDYQREIEALKKLAALPPADRREYMTTYTLYDRLDECRKEKRYADALRSAEQMRDIYRRILGPDSFYVAVATRWCGEVLHDDGRYELAAKQLREALRIFQGIVGEDHTVVADLDLQLARDLDRLGQDEEAGRMYEAALRLMTRLRGETHPWTSVATNNLAGHLEKRARFRDAELLYRRALRTLQAAEGNVDALLATAYNNLAHNLHSQGKYAEAEKLYQTALTIRRKIGGEDHPDTGRVYMNLAGNREAQGDYAEAEPLLRKALTAYTKGYGRHHVETAWAMNNLAVNLDQRGKAAAAEPLLRDALEIVLRAPGDQSRAVGTFSGNLASCLREQGKHAKARELSEKALSILRDRLGPDHPSVAVAHNNLATALHDQEKYADAEQHFREGLAILEKRLGKDHPDTAHDRVNLGINLYDQGRFGEAGQQIQEALEVLRRVLGEGHPRTAWAYKNLIGNCCARGDYPQALALAAAAARSFETARRRMSFGGLERSALTHQHSPFPCLAVAAARLGKLEAAWQALEQNLARGLLDDLAAQRIGEEDRERERVLLGRLDLLDQQVAAPRAGQSVEELRRQRDAALGEYVGFQADLAARYGVAAGEVYDLPRIQAQLPADTALLAWVDLGDKARRADPKGDHWACLVRHRGAPVWVRLPGTGADGAWTDEDIWLAERVRGAFVFRPADAAGPWIDLTRRLARQRLAPLEEHLNAQADRPAVRHLIVLPSHEMSRIPVEAFTDRVTVSYAPSGTMFAWLRERRAAREVPAATLFALGDPAFRPAGGGTTRGEFGRLAWARQELQGISRLHFDKVERLMGSEASERNVNRLAEGGRLREFRYLHFATHGVLDTRHPMWSALILAQDQPPDSPGQDQGGNGAGNGRLTAERVLRDWKLDAELVTLSACKTGLGPYAGGEGYLGFSQALFLAGARSLVLSLWEVDDAATALLMTRFYENLIGERAVKPMSKAEALAEAKRWLRGLGPGEVNRLTKDLPTRGTRGKVVPLQPAGNGQAVHTYEHPYYWSGFILIGDPR